MTWLEREVRNASLRQLGVCALIIAGVIGMLVYNLRYLTNVFAGAHDIPRQELLAAASPEDLERYWVRLKPDQIVDTGIDIITINKKRGVETGRRVSGHYFIGVLGEKLLLIKHGSKTKPDMAMLEGAVLGPNEWYMAQLASDPASAKYTPAFLPMTLDTGDFIADANLILAGAAIASALALIWALWAVYRAANPAGHKALQGLAAGPGETLADASRSIAADIKARRTTKLSDGTRLTSGYVLQSSALRFGVRSLATLLWTYPIVTHKKLYGFIPTGKSHSAALFFTDKELTVKGSEQQISDAMRHVSAAAPWALIGHSSEIETAYKKNRRDLTAFVDDRRRQSMAAAAASPASGAPS